MSSIREAAANGDIEGVKRFLKKGVSPDERGKNNLKDGFFFFLFFFFSFFFSFSLSLLIFPFHLKTKTKKQKQKKKGYWTPLHFASHGGHVEVVELLLTAGAKIEEKFIIFFFFF